MKLSIIVPVYFNQDNLKPLYQTLKETILDKVDYELIFVDDGSKDASFEVMSELKQADKNIKSIRLSKNFGSHAAILAGMSVATGDAVTAISADLQDPPEIILQMLEKFNEGSKVVLAARSDRREGFFTKLFSGMYYSIMKKIALPAMPKGGFDSFLISRQVVDVINGMEEKNTTLMGQVLWCGFKTDIIYYVRQKREIGKSRWTFGKKFKLAMDSVLSFSYFPIRFISTIGALFFLGSIIWALAIFILKLAGGIDAVGYTTLIIVNLFSFGTIMLTLGVIGEYLWRTFDAARKRPPFIIDESDIEHEDTN